MKWPSIDCKYLNIMIIDFPLKVLSIQDQQTTNELAHELQLRIANLRWVCPSVQSWQSLPSACPHKMMVESAHQCSLARAFTEPSQCLPTQDNGWVCPSVQSCQSLYRVFPVLAHTRWWLSLPISAVLPEPSQSLPSAYPHKIMVESAHQCSLARAFTEPSQCLPTQDNGWVCPSVQSCQSLYRVFPVLAHTRWWLSLPISAVLTKPSQCLPKQDDGWVCPSVQSCQSLSSAGPHKMMVESAHQCSLDKAFPVLAQTRWWLSLPISAVLTKPSQCLPK